MKHPTFTIIGGTGDYSDLVGVTGEATSQWQVKRNGDIRVYRTLTGSIIR